MTSKLTKAVLNITLGAGLVSTAFLSPLLTVPYFSQKEAERVQQMPQAVQRTYELEKELNKALKGKQGLEAAAAASWPEFRTVYGPALHEYAELIAREDVETARKEESAKRVRDNMYILASAMCVAVIAGGILVNLGSITNRLCGDKKEKYDD